MDEVEPRTPSQRDSIVSHASTPPDSPLTTNLHQASITIDDLTAALANFSRGTTPEPHTIITCCCGKSDCENLENFEKVKRKLERGLVLSGEVGQALLQRHEAYVRRQESLTKQAAEYEKRYREATKRIHTLTQSNDHAVSKMADLVRENAQLDKRLTQSLLNVEVAEASNRTLLHEIQEARATVTRLNAQQARFIGWDTRLMSLTQERDDLREERKSESTRAKASDMKAAAMAEKCAKLQAELFRMREEMENSRLSRSELSNEILQDAREKLHMLQSSLGSTSMAEVDSEVTRVLESLVGDSEALKRENAELQNLLGESREDIRSLREQLEEHTAAFPPVLEDNSLAPGRSVLHSRNGSLTPSSFGFTRGHRATDSIASSIAPISPRELLFPRGPPRTSSPLYSFNRKVSTRRRPASAERSILVEDDTEDEEGPERLPVSLPSSEMKGSSPMHVSYELDSDSQRDCVPPSPPRARRKQLMLLSRSRGVQTDGTNTLSHTPSPRPGSSFGGSYSPILYLDGVGLGEGPSETSSIHDNRSPALAALVDRVTSLLARMTQADVRTLSNRLKRQHLAVGDVGHLSRTTLHNILSDVAGLRSHFRNVFEDDKSTAPMTRREFRGLIKLVGDCFSEMAQLRTVVNEVTLDPGVAMKLKDDAAGSSSNGGLEERGRGPGKSPSGIGTWIAPISKFFGGPSPDVNVSEGRSSVPKGRPPRVAPKLAPAISASTTTVNVEFASSGTRRAVSSSVGNVSGDPTLVVAPSGVAHVPQPSATQSREHLLGIFAGAPRGKREEWVVVKPTARPRLKPSTTNLASGPSFNPHRLSRIVDAMVEDPNSSNYQDTLLERTLRPRGLSDSSIHTTFLTDGRPAMQRLVTPAGLALTAPDMSTAIIDTTSSGTVDRSSVLEALSRKMQAFRVSQSPNPALPPPSPNRPAHAEGSSKSADPRALSPSGLQRRPEALVGARNIIPATWAAEHGIGDDLLKHGSLQDSLLTRTFGGRGRDF